MAKKVIALTFRPFLATFSKMNGNGMEKSGTFKTWNEKKPESLKPGMEKVIHSRF
jgi:hypothetical protein